MSTGSPLSVCVFWGSEIRGEDPSSQICHCDVIRGRTEVKGQKYPADRLAYNDPHGLLKDVQDLIGVRMSTH